IVVAKRIAGGLKLEALLAADTVGICEALPYAIPNPSRVQIDDERAAAGKFLLLTVRDPALRELNYHANALLPAGPHSAYRPYGMNLEVREPAGDAVHLALEVFPAEEAKRFGIGIGHIRRFEPIVQPRGVPF